MDLELIPKPIDTNDTRFKRKNYSKEIQKDLVSYRAWF